MLRNLSGVLMLGMAATAIGVAGAFMHEWRRPLGLILALSATAAVVYVSRWWLTNRLGMTVVAALWLVPVLVLSGRRPEGDVVIQANIPGLVLIFGGAVILAIGLGMGSLPARMPRFDEL